MFSRLLASARQTNTDYHYIIMIMISFDYSHNYITRVLKVLKKEINKYIRMSF